MGNVATSIEDQINLLQKRGLIIEDLDKAKETLLDIGYYRLGFYWHHFYNSKKEEFAENVNFKDITDLYYFDTELRFLLTQYLTRIEINFRTKVVYYISNKYKNSPTWFVDPKVIDNQFIKDFDNHYNEDFKRINVIKNHHKKYINDKYAPAWKTLEYFTFGTVFKIFESLNEDNIKERISNCYDMYDIYKFMNFMKNIIFLRNICAHGGVLYDLNLGKGFSKIHQINYSSRNTHTLDAACKVISFLLYSISENRRNDFEIQLKTILDKYFVNQKVKDIIKSKTDF
jgi:abortive infection bacteriophage resistance protein